MRSIVTDPPRQLPPETVVDNDVYFSEDVLEQEVDRIFHRQWIFTLHESEIAAPGDYRVIQVGRYELIVCRDADGKLRAFHNTCRHRGAPLVRELAGNLRRFQCFYHLFFYRLGGELAGQGLGGELAGVAQPKGYECTSFRKEDFPLLEADIESFRGLVFVNIANGESRGGPSLQSHLAGLWDDPVVAEICHPNLEVFHFHKQVMRTNWKFYVDNNRDQYHSNMHPFLRRVAPEMLTNPDVYATRSVGNGHTIMIDSDPTSPGITEYGRAGYNQNDAYQIGNPMPGVKPGGFAIIHIFPDVMINIRSNVMRIDRVTPLSIGESQIEFRGLGLSTDATEIRDARVETHNLHWGLFGRVLPEDTVAIETQYRSLRPGINRWSILARDLNRGFTDEFVNRVFYDRWTEVTGLSSTYDPKEGEG